MKKTIIIICPEPGITEIVPQKFLNCLVGIDPSLANNMTIYTFVAIYRLGGGGGDRKQIYVEVRSDDPNDAFEVTEACKKINVPEKYMDFVIDFIEIRSQNRTIGGS